LTVADVMVIISPDGTIDIIDSEDDPMCSAMIKGLEDAGIAVGDRRWIPCG